MPHARVQLAQASSEHGALMALTCQCEDTVTILGQLRAELHTDQRVRLRVCACMCARVCARVCVRVYLCG